MAEPFRVVGFREKIVPIGTVALKSGYLFHCEHGYLLILKADTTLELTGIGRLFQQR